MAQNLQIVFSRIPDHVDEDEFNAWYDAHLAEILSIPGFVSAQRYRLEPVVVDAGEPVTYRYLSVYEIEGDPDELLAQMERASLGTAEPVTYRYLSVYEIEGDPDELLAQMERASLGTADSYRERKDAGDSGPELPSWWDEVSFASWNCIAIGDRITAR
jgi:hypothetical protein